MMCFGNISKYILPLKHICYCKINYKIKVMSIEYHWQCPESYLGQNRYPSVSEHHAYSHPKTKQANIYIK